MENIYTSIEPFFRVAKIFGLFPMSFQNPIQKGKIVFTGPSVLATILTFLVLILLHLIVIYNQKELHGTDSSFLTSAVWSWFLIFVLPLIAIQLVIQIKNVKDIANFFDFMDQIDIKMYELRIDIDHKRHKTVVTFTTALGVGNWCIRIITLPLYLIFVWADKLRYAVFFHELSYICFLTFEYFFVLQFLFPCYLLRERLKMMKGRLR